MTNKLFPYGMCECPSPTLMCCGGVGPVAYEVTRNGKRLRLCTRCTLSGDTERKLLLTRDDPAQLYIDFDALGAFCIMIEMAASESGKGDYDASL